MPEGWVSAEGLRFLKVGDHLDVAGMPATVVAKSEHEVAISIDIPFDGKIPPVISLDNIWRLGDFGE